MKLGDSVKNFTPPPHPKGVVLEGSFARLEPLDVQKHAEDLFDSNGVDSEGKNWAYLPYGPFEALEDYVAWLESVCRGELVACFG